MNILWLPLDMIYYIASFLSTKEKIVMRESNKYLNKPLTFLQIRIEKFEGKLEKLLNGRLYILCRLRLAALCGMDNYTVADIWSWVTLVGDIKSDALPILRQLGNAIN